MAGKRKRGDDDHVVVDDGTPSRPRRQSRGGCPTVDDDAADGVLYGEGEVVAAYVGNRRRSARGNRALRPDEKDPFCFLRLRHDVFRGALDDEEVWTEWLTTEDGTDYGVGDDGERYGVAVGCLITAVTGSVVEYEEEERWKIPEKVKVRVRAVLERQLKGEEEKEEDGDDFEKRSKKRRRLTRKSRPVKKEKAKKTATGDPDEKVATQKSPKKETTSKKAPKLEPRPDLVQLDDPRRVETGNLSYVKKGRLNTFHGDTHRASKEVIRSYLSDDADVFRDLLEKPETCADLFCFESVASTRTVLHHAVARQDADTVMKLLTIMKGGRNASRPAFPMISLTTLTSGRHTSRYADYNRYQVAAARGGKEGNNAFTKDELMGKYRLGMSEQLPPGRDMAKLLAECDAVSVAFLKRLDAEAYGGNLIGYDFDLTALVVAGHTELAHYAAERLVDRGVGLNQLHVDCLSPKKIKIDPKTRAASVLKMTSHSPRACPVHFAAASGNVDRLRALLAIAPEARDRHDDNGAGPLHYAASAPSDKALAWLLSGNNASPNERTSKGTKDTPLLRAVRAGRPANAKALLDALGEDVAVALTATDSGGWTAVHAAAASSRSTANEVLAVLLKGGADPDAAADARLLEKKTPLILCAERGNLEGVRILSEAGADLHRPDKLGRTPLIHAVLNGHAHVLTFLLRAGVPADDADTSGNAALHYAAAYGWIECLAPLSELAAENLNPRNDWSDTPLSLALKRGRSGCAVFLLDRPGVDVNVEDRSGTTLLHALVRAWIRGGGNNKTTLPWAVTRLLEREEVDASKPSKETGGTVLHEIASDDEPVKQPAADLAATLIRRGADPLVRDDEGRSATDVALAKGHLQLAAMLLEAADHKDTCPKGATLLHALAKQTATVKPMFFGSFWDLLVKTNEEWTARRDEHGRTPLLVASGAMREAWRTNAKACTKNLDHALRKSSNERCGDVATNTAAFQEWCRQYAAGDDELSKSWPTAYADGSRAVIHDLVTCPDAEWALRTCASVLERVSDATTLCRLKTNAGEDALSLALQTHASNGARMTPQVSNLVKILIEHGADPNGIPHPHFTSLDEVKDTPKERRPAPTKGQCTEEEVATYVREEQAEIARKLWLDEKRRAGQFPKFVPRLHALLGSYRPSPNDSFPEFLSELFRDRGFLPNVRDAKGNTALHLFHRDVRVFEMLAAHADVNAVNDDGEWPLLRAVDAGVAFVDVLLKRGAEANLHNDAGTALHRAVRSAKEDVLGSLLAAECDLDAPDVRGLTALHHAVVLRAVATEESLDPVEARLLRAGANATAPDNDGRTPLHHAFLPEKADVKCDFPYCPPRDPVDVLTALSAAPDAKLDSVDAEGRTPLHYAAACGAAICALRLTEGSDLDKKDEDGNTPLGLALRAGRADAVIVLVSRGCDVNVEVTDVERTRNKDGTVRVVRSVTRHALERALSEKTCESVARYMMSSDKIPAVTVVASLMRTGNFRLAVERVKNDRDKDSLRTTPCDADGNTLLHLAVSAAPDAATATATTDALIAAGLDVGARRADGRVPLHLAARRGCAATCRHLVEKHGADPDAMDEDGGSPTSVAFEGETLDADVVFALAEASKDAKKSVDANVKVDHDPKTEERWSALEDVETWFSRAPVEKRHALEEYVKRHQNKPLDETTTTSTKTISSTTLIEAVKRNNVALVNALLSYGANGAATDAHGRTALHHAAIGNVNTTVVALLRRRNRVPLNARDSFGRTALDYAVFTGDAFPVLGTLKAHGAESRTALEWAVRTNRETLATDLASRRTVVADDAVEPTEATSVLAAGTRAWVRYDEACARWYSAIVVSSGEAGVDVLPVDQQLDEQSKAGALASVAAPRERRSRVVEGVPRRLVVPIVPDADVLEPVENALVSLMMGDDDEASKKRLVRNHQGHFKGLWSRLRDDPKRDVLLSDLKSGDLVGVLDESLTRLNMCTITKAWPNGTYDVSLSTGGSPRRWFDRTQLRPLRPELRVRTEPVTLTNGGSLVRACVRPTAFGSFENLSLLRALVAAGCPPNEEDDKGRAPLDMARPGSETQSYLREITKRPDGGRRPPTVVAESPRSAFDFAADAEAEQEALLRANDHTERVVPKVSPVCELKSKGIRVAEDGENDHFDVALSKVDVMYGQYGKYVFYKMQVVHDPVSETHVLLTNWGRIGERGKYQQTPFNTQDAAAAEFRKVFKSKTGNHWKDKESFERKPRKYSLVKRPKVRLSRPERLLQSVAESSEHSCSLNASVADALRFLLNSNALASAYSNSGVDKDRLPFGELSSDTIRSAEKKLREIKDALDARDALGPNKTIDELRAALEAVAKVSSEFHELLPMGDEIVTPFEQNDARFGKAVEVVRLLRDLTITKQLLLGARRHRETTNPIDYAYKALGVGITPLEVDSHERVCLMRHVDSTCTNGDVVVQQIYALETGKEPCDVPNKRLLFHGSSNSNIFGILKHGLLIAPPEAPRSGLAYGKGVYFADQFDKALGYTSFTSHSACVSEQPRSFVFVAEVALGKSYTPLGPEYMEKPHDGTNSTQALGAAGPDESQNLTLDSNGCVVSLGDLKSTTPLTKHRWYCDRYCALAESESAKIEDKRTDPNTEFPVDVTLVHLNQKHVVTLLSPDSQTAEMSRARAKARSGKKRKKDDENEEEEEVRVSISSTSESTSGAAKTLHRKSSDSHKYGHSEFIVYDTKQVRLKYLIELTNARWVRKKHKIGEEEFVDKEKECDEPESMLFGDSDDDSEEGGDY